MNGEPTDTAADPGPRVRRPVRLAVIASGVVLAALLVLLATRDVQRNQPSFGVVGEIAPAVAGVSYDGTAVDLDAELRSGNWVVLNFFASWCTPCIAENPELVAFAERHATDNVRLIGVAVNDREQDVVDFFAERGGDWPVVVGAGDTNRIVVAYGVTAPPTTVIIGPDGVVQNMVIGETSAGQLDGLLADAGFR